MPENPALSETPWLLGTGLDTDMKSERRVVGKQRRFFLIKGESREVVWLTELDNFKVYWEHNLQIGRAPGSWSHFCTCVASLGIECPICMYSDTHNGRYYRSKIAVGTLLDLKPYTNRQNKEILRSRTIIGMKQPIVEKLRRRGATLREKNLSLRFAKFRIHRGAADNSAGTGDDFEYIEHIDPKNFPPEDLQELPYDFIKPDVEIAKRMLKAASYYGDSDVGQTGQKPNNPNPANKQGGERSGDDIPFDSAGAPPVDYT